MPSLARELRERSTEAEAALWELLRDRKFRGLKFRRQAPVGTCITDFLCAQLKLAIELDGEVHDAAPQTARDAFRTELLREQGYRVVRFRNHQVLDDPAEVLRQLARTIERS